MLLGAFYLPECLRFAGCRYQHPLIQKTQQVFSAPANMQTPHFYRQHSSHTPFTEKNRGSCASWTSSVTEEATYCFGFSCSLNGRKHHVDSQARAIQNDESEDWQGSFCPDYWSQAFEQKEAWGFLQRTNKEKFVWWLKEGCRGTRFGAVRGCLGKTNQPTEKKIKKKERELHLLDNFFNIVNIVELSLKRKAVR